MFGRKFFLGMLSILLGIIIIGCASMGSSSNNDLFIVKESSTNDIKGTIYDKSMTIYKRSPTMSSIWGMDISFIQRSSGDITANMIYVLYLGEDWRFYDKIQIKIDNNLYEIHIDNPAREVRSRGTVLEQFNAILPKPAINNLKNCSSIIIQIDGKNRGEPIQIAPEGISKINSFWQNN